MLTVKEVAGQLRLSLKTIYALCQRRMLRHERFGLGRGKILIPEDAVEEYRAGATVGVRRQAVPEPAPPVRARRLRHLSLE